MAVTVNNSAESYATGPEQPKSVPTGTLDKDDRGARTNAVTAS